MKPRSRRFYPEPRTITRDNAVAVTTEIQLDAMRYQRANSFISELRKHSRRMTTGQFYQLRRMALAGLFDDAKAMLTKIVYGN